MKPINIALVGFGNIGTGVVRFFQQNGTLINQRCGRDVNLHTICTRDVKKDRGLPISNYNLTTDFNDVFANDEIDIVLELVGGTTVAREIILGALKAGKHVVTANKAVLAEHGGDLFETARENNVTLLFEAAVGAGIPFIRAMQAGLLANNFYGIYGILNGTCNYILTEMEDDPEKDFDSVLKVAMDLGYAEPDPTLDIQGDDAAHKIAIMGSIAFNYEFKGNDVIKDGITRISPVDFEFSKKHNQTIKLIATANVGQKGDINLSVAPTLLPASHLLAGIRSVVNTCLVECDQAGPMQFSGAGAGQGSTSSGVIGDVCNLAMAGDKSTAMNPLKIRKGNRPSQLNAIPYPERITRLTGDKSKQFAEENKLKIVDEIGSSIFVVTPAQSIFEHEVFLNNLKEKGFKDSDICELRVAFQSPDSSLI